MRDIKIDEVVKFTVIDEFTGQEMQLIGTVKGDYIKVREQYPKEAGSASEDTYLIEVGNRSGLFVITRDEVLKSFGIKEN